MIRHRRSRATPYCFNGSVLNRTRTVASCSPGDERHEREHNHDHRGGDAGMDVRQSQHVQSSPQPLHSLQFHVVMSQILPDPIERYLAAVNRRSDPLLDEIAADGHRRQLPIVHPETGRLLQVLATAIGARRILEIGTAIGYSAAWMARALPADGLLITIERDHERAARARENFARAGVAGRVSVMVGDAARLVWKVGGPFDLIFQDGDKPQYEPLLDRLLDLLRPAGLLVADNALWRGEVVPGYVERPYYPREETEAIAAYNQRLAGDGRVLSVVLPIGDGVSVAVKL
jgi:predicted O-methyltransferase YrrM